MNLKRLRPIGDSGVARRWLMAMVRNGPRYLNWISCCLMAHYLFPRIMDGRECGASRKCWELSTGASWLGSEDWPIVDLYCLWHTKPKMMSSRNTWDTIFAVSLDVGKASSYPVKLWRVRRQQSFFPLFHFFYFILNSNWSSPSHPLAFSHLPSPPT